MFNRQTEIEIIAFAQSRQIDPAALFAVVEVESGGKVFADVSGRQEPVIRFEGHYFDRRLQGKLRQRAREAGLASPSAGKIRNPSSQAARWSMLNNAARIDHAAAHESVSWGLGQVMGAHWKRLGYKSVDALVAECRGGAVGQVALMMRFIEATGLLPVLREKDWAAFAKAYNGPDYARNAYDRRMADAYARHRKRMTALVVVPTSAPVADTMTTARPIGKETRLTLAGWLRTLISSRIATVAAREKGR